MKRTSGKRWISLVLALCLCLLVGCGGKQTGYDPLKGVETRMITDFAGRQVEIPAEITRIAPSGSTAQMILMPVAYDLLVGLSSSPSTAQMSYFPEEMRYLPTFGQFYGSKASLNMESLIAAQPQLIIDLGDAKDSIAKDMDTIQKQTGIPTIFIEADLDDMAAAYRTLGDILGRQEQAEELAQFIDRTVTMAQTNAAKIPESQRLKVLFGTGSTGLACNAAGSVQADVIDLVGAVNAIIPEEVTNRGGGTTVSLEEVYAVEPDVILLSSGGPYDTLTEGDWAGLTAVQQGRYYEIPGLPYDWMSSPPSVNRVLGIWWLGNLVQRTPDPALRHRLQGVGAGRLPLVRDQGHRTALPLRIRTFVHHVRAFETPRPEGVPRRQAAEGERHADQHGRPRGRGGRAALRHGERPDGPPAEKGAERLPESDPGPRQKRRRGVRTRPAGAGVLGHAVARLEGQPGRIHPFAGNLVGRHRRHAARLGEITPQRQERTASAESSLLTIVNEVSVSRPSPRLLFLPFIAHHAE